MIGYNLNISFLIGWRAHAYWTRRAALETEILKFFQGSAAKLVETKQEIQIFPNTISEFGFFEKFNSYEGFARPQIHKSETSLELTYYYTAQQHVNWIG